MTIDRAPTRVGLYGHGRVNTAVHGLVDGRDDLEVTAVVRSEHSPEQTSEILRAAGVEVVVVATKTLMTEIAGHVLAACEAARHVLCTSEELAFRSVDELPDELAAAIGAGRLTLVTAGLNPGWVFDAAPLALAATMSRVTSVSCGRLVDISGFGPTVRRNLGMGVSRQAFDDDVASGRIRGHVGFERSAQLLSERLGLGLDSFAKVISPIMDESSDGLVVGIRQRAIGKRGEEVVIDYDFTAHLDPASAGMVPRDWTVLRGDGAEQRIDLTPGLAPVPSTAAILVNAIAPVLALGPGIYGTADVLPLFPGNGRTEAAR